MFCLTNVDGSFVGKGPAVSEFVVVQVAVDTVNDDVLVTVTPLTVTAISPDVAPAGTTTVSWVAVAAITVAVVPLMVTMLFASVVLKLVPVITIDEPVAALEVKLEMVGFELDAAAIVKSADDVAMRLFVVTVIFPVVEPPDGTVTVSWVVVAAVTTATAPLIVTALAEIVVLKLVPVMTTDEPTTPLVGVKLVMVGLAADATVTVKLASDVAVLPFTVTVMGPDVAPAGTATVNCVLVAVIGDADVPLNFIVLSPAMSLKLTPVMVTVVFSGPLVGEKVEIDGVAMVSSSWQADKTGIMTDAPPSLFRNSVRFMGLGLGENRSER